MSAQDEYPKLVLDNGEIRVSVYLPDAARGYYRGTRFDWSGIVERVDYAGHRFYAPLHATHDPHRHDCVSGPAEEFGMTAPIGFAEAGPGESFLKPGVGLLRKGEADEYRFNGDYEMIRAGDWDIDRQRERVTFLQELRGERGWAYRYRKTVRLVPGRPEMVIEHRLDNSGEKTIDVDHYNHNFTIVDDTPYGPGYRVEFPFATERPIQIDGVAWFRANAIEVDRPLQDKSLWLPVFEGGGRARDNAARVVNERTGAAVEFAGDAPLNRMVFWAVERAACPEPFIDIHLEPGQAREWSSRYRYGHGAGSSAAVNRG